MVGELVRNEIQARFTVLNEATPKLKKIRKEFGKITAAINKSMVKRGGFDFNKQFDMGFANASAKQLSSTFSKMRVGMKSASSVSEALKRSFPTPKVADGIKQMESSMLQVTNGMDKQLSVRSKFAKDGYAKHMRGLNKTFKSVMTSAKPLARGFENIDKFMGRMTKKSKNIKQSFDMKALGIMFFGMAIQRVFMGIAKASTEMFNKIMESSEGGATNVQILGTMFDFLKFKIGSAINNAIGPLMPKIWEVVNNIATWIDKNEELIAKIIAVGFAIGSFLLIVGILKLGFGALGGYIKPVVGLLGAGGTAGLLGVLALLTVGFMKFKKSADKGFETKTLDVFKSTSDGLFDIFKDLGLEIDDLGDLLDVFAGTAYVVFKVLALLISAAFNSVFALINAGIASIFESAAIGFRIAGQKERSKELFAKAKEFRTNVGENLGTVGSAFKESASTLEKGVGAGFKMSEMMVDESINININVEGSATPETSEMIANDVSEIFNQRVSVFR